MARPVKTAQGTWRIQIEVRGVRDSITLPTRREAVEWAALRKAALLAVADGRGGTVYTLRQALRRYAQDDLAQQAAARGCICHASSLSGQGWRLSLRWRERREAVIIHPPSSAAS